ERSALSCIHDSLSRTASCNMALQIHLLMLHTSHRLIQPFSSPCRISSRHMSLTDNLSAFSAPLPFIRYGAHIRALPARPRASDTPSLPGSPAPCNGTVTPPAPRPPS